MAAYGLKPAFKDLDGYKQWRKVWAETYSALTHKIRKNKIKLTNMQRQFGTQDASVRKAQMVLLGERVMAYKLNSLLNEAKIRMQNITKMKSDIVEHMAQFPISIDGCKNVDFHFNKKHLEHDFVPMWIVKAKGTSFYVHHVESRATWTTRETPDHPATKGAIRFRSCNVSISADGIATIS
jgi:hypothetical protein